MSFNDELLKDGRGRVIRVDVSTDKFATISYRWGEVSGVLDGTNQYESRVLSVAPVRRALGENRVATGSSCALVLDNADGALDALAGAESIQTQAALRFRIYLAVYNPAADPLVFTAKLLGEFSLGSSWIRQDNERLTLSLGDDVMGAIAQQAALPTFHDWQAVGGSAATNPLYDAYGLPDSENEYTPLQLAFGEDWVLAHPHVLPFGTVDAAYQGKVIVPICCTSSTAAASSTEITNLRILWLNSNSKKTQLVDVPPTIIDTVAGVSTTVTVWSIERSPTITKDGKTFKIIYLVVRADLGALNPLNNYLTGQAALANDSGGNNATYDSPQFAQEWAGNYSPNSIYTQRGYASNDPTRPQYASMAAGVLAWYAKGVPLSARTQTTVNVQHPVDVLTDLVSYYSNNTSITIDTTMAARVKTATRMNACAGTVQSWVNGPKRGDPVFSPPPSLRQTITAICQSSDIDCFIDWSGQFSFSCDFWDFAIATSGSATWTPDGATGTSGNGTTTAYIPAVIPETWLAEGMERWIPADGERWAPYNRLWMTGGRTSPGDGINDVPYQGPWDFTGSQIGAISTVTRILEGSLPQGWRPFRQIAQAPWFWRALNVTARDMVRFRTHIGGLQLELGQYFALSWGRGDRGGPYSGTIFQCEGIIYSPDDDTVEVTAVWRQDVTTERAYLLDDETLLVRGKGALTGAATCDLGGGDLVDFGGTINLTTMGVVAGDIFILRDSSEAADEFEFNLAVRILTVVDPTEIQVDHFWPASGPASTPNAEWSIVRGATTYPTSATDPTNYPLEGDVYGKTTLSDGSGVYSNDAQGNRLNSG